MRRLLIIIYFGMLISCTNTIEKDQAVDSLAERRVKEKVSSELGESDINEDSVKIIASMFLYEDVEEGLPYYLEEPDLYKVYETNQFWVKNYFPTILETYELRYYQKLNIAYYLYKTDKPRYFKNLADSTNLNDEEKRVLRWYISNYRMNFE